MLGILLIVAALVLVLVVIRLTSLRKRLERLDRERPERDARTAEEIRLRPLSFVLALIFVGVSALGVIYIFAFSDTSEDRWQHFSVVFPLAAVVGTCLAFAKKREDQRSLSLRTRRFIWGVILGGYAVAFMIILGLGLSPFSRFSEMLRLFCYLGTLAPLAFVAWSLFQNSKGEANQSADRMPGSNAPGESGRP